jgi:hypothetical protein
MQEFFGGRYEIEKVSDYSFTCGDAVGGRCARSSGERGWTTERASDGLIGIEFAPCQASSQAQQEFA